MKKKTVLIIAGASLFVGLLAGHFLIKPSGPDPAYWVERSEYDQNAADMEKGLQESFRLLAERDAIIRRQDEFVALGQRKIMELEETQKKEASDGRKLADENRRLKAEAAAVIAANPAVRALIENYDLRCENYEKQIFTLTQAGAEKDKVIEAQGVKIVSIAYQRDTCKKAWEDEHALRLVSDGLRLDLEKKYKVDKFWATLGKWGPPIAFGLGLVL